MLQIGVQSLVLVFCVVIGIIDCWDQFPSSVAIASTIPQRKFFYCFKRGHLKSDVIDTIEIGIDNLIE